MANYVVAKRGAMRPGDRRRRACTCLRSLNRCFLFTLITFRYIDDAAEDDKGEDNEDDEGGDIEWPATDDEDEYRPKKCVSILL